MLILLSRGGKMNDDKIICNCRNVTVGKIRKAITDGAASFEEVQEKTGAGRSCGGCVEHLKAVVEDLLKKSEI